MRLLASAFAATALAAFPAAASGKATYTCDLHGLDGALILDISGDVELTPDEHPSSLVGAGGPALAFSGKLRSDMAEYTLTGRGAAGNLTDLASDETYDVGFRADGASLIIAINPDTPGQTLYRCAGS